MSDRNRYRILDTYMARSVQFGEPRTVKTVTSWEQCIDTVGQFNSDNPFSLTKFLSEPSTLVKKKNNSSFNLTYGEVHSLSGLHPGHLPYPGSGRSVNSLAVQGLARANPSNSNFSAPTFIGELKDLPSLVRGAGRSVGRRSQSFRKELTDKDSLKATPFDGSIKKNPFKDSTLTVDDFSFAEKTSRRILGRSADGLLAINFALLPMINDFWSMLEQAESVNKSFLEIEKMISNGGSSRSRTVNEGSAAKTDIVPIAANFAGVKYVSRRRHTSARAWVSSKWIPTSPPTVSRDELRKKIRKAKSGFNKHGFTQTAWELLPWSFALDYFGNVGDFLSATNDSLAKYERVCVMIETVTHTDLSGLYDHPNNTDNGVEITALGKSTFITKRRIPVAAIYPSFGGESPLSRGQSRNLLALTTKYAVR